MVKIAIVSHKPQFPRVVWDFAGQMDRATETALWKNLKPGYELIAERVPSVSLGDRWNIDRSAFWTGSRYDVSALEKWIQQVL